MNKKNLMIKKQKFKIAKKEQTVKLNNLWKAICNVK